MFGISAFAETPFASEKVATFLSGVQAAGAVGAVLYEAARAITGVASAGAVGSVVLSRTVALTGVQAAGQVGNVGKFYWLLIDDSQTPNWQNVGSSQTPNWANIPMVA
jgi:hypothetical protein